jgi:hypothetical protein
MTQLPPPVRAQTANQVTTSVEPRKGLVLVWVGASVAMLTPSQVEDLIKALSRDMKRAGTAHINARR